MLHKTKAIVLHTIKYAESSVIVKAYTGLFGVQSYLVNSVRSRKNKNKTALLQPLSLLEMVVYHKEKEGLQRIKEIKMDYAFTSIPYDIIKSSLALFIAEILYKSIREEEQNKSMFEFLSSSIQLLDSDIKGIANFHLVFMIKLSQYLGFYPNGSYSDKKPFFDLQEGIFETEEPFHKHFLTPEIALHLSSLLKTDFDTLHELALSRNARNNLLEKLIEYYQLHLTSIKEIKSHHVLGLVMN